MKCHYDYRISQRRILALVNFPRPGYVVKVCTVEDVSWAVF